ncbi:MarR family winged helix-turn-helix transcriptional regulator [Frigoribacterium sp. VKM Ac-2836]|uniref:MarR family winged helix-turn-helix transcriptional regulator n=1 Tax=Frigoribacterium sp. VKM Ac-2836 TaxID=2739014 RepID=UPI001563749C|nr:MarR family transcriptional regulator [Frigoribacterium sp. VKM Ac-2836]NRD27924.1 MarR family transcriptional regulator [Frigoribacterium sp. VKM Ac-2836]
MTRPPQASSPAEPTIDHPAEPRADDVSTVLIALQHLQSRMAFVNDRLAKRIGVGATDFLALVHLSVQGDTPPKKVGEALGLSSGAMTALADRLEAAGLVSRQQHPSDRRSFVLALTAEGASGVEGAGATYARAVQEALPASRRPVAEAVFRDLGTALGVLAP